MTARWSFKARGEEKTLGERLISLNWFVVLLIAGLAAAGVAMQYSVAGGDMQPYAARQGIRFIFALIVMLVLAVTNIRIWMALAYPAWLVGVILLLIVEFAGDTGMGGQRWLDLKIIRLQPSELMKIALVMALARYFHGLEWRFRRKFTSLFVPVVLIVVPMFLVARQPDLGTALMIAATGIVVLFLAGVPQWLFWTGGIAGTAAIPIGLQLMKDYQRARVMTFLNPEADPLGAGYQITQSKIALGSGGLDGKGFLEGTQSQLNFLPEMKTDFIFTSLVEEFGLIGGLIILGLFALTFLYALLMGIGSRSQFGRLLAGGLSFTLFLYVMINVGMVMGLMPVVGVPLPLLSYGGSSMLTFMAAYGLILSVATHRQITLAPKGSGL